MTSIFLHCNDDGSFALSINSNPISLFHVCEKGKGVLRWGTIHSIVIQETYLVLEKFSLWWQKKFVCLCVTGKYGLKYNISGSYFQFTDEQRPLLLQSKILISIVLLYIETVLMFERQQ